MTHHKRFEIREITILGKTHFIANGILDDGQWCEAGVGDTAVEALQKAEGFLRGEDPDDGWDGKTWPPPQSVNTPAVLHRIWDRLNDLEKQLKFAKIDAKQHVNHVHDVKGMQNTRTSRPRPKDYLD